MRSKFINFLKIALPLSFGLFLIWYVYGSLEPSEKKDLFSSIERANYWWVLASIGLGVLSHLSRAYRWKYLLDPLGLRPKFANSFFAVMIGYLINLLIPRAGELSRCGVLSRYEKMPFTKLFGTVIAERIADIVILCLIIMVVIISQFGILGATISSWIPQPKDQTYFLYTAVAIGGIIGLSLVILYFSFKKSSHHFIHKLKLLLLSFMEGLKTIIKMESAGKFIFHTLFIWFMYFCMFYLCFYSLPETTNVPIAGILAAFVMGGLSIIFVQGGIGVYPAAIMEVLVLYGISRAPSLALGWIIWTSQTAMVLILGIISLLVVARFNKKQAYEK